MLSIFCAGLRQRMPRGHESQQAGLELAASPLVFQLHRRAGESELLNPCSWLLSSREGVWGMDVVLRSSPKESNGIVL